MLKNLRFVGVVVAVSCVLAPMRTIGQSADSPTKHNPRFLWSPQQQAAWNKMRSQNLPSWRQILQGCEADNTASTRYASYGRWASLCYQITGDDRYAEKAWGQWSRAKHGKWTAPLFGNELREHGTEYVMVMRERLLPWLEKTGNLTTLDTYLKLTAENVFKTGVRFYDSDQLTGTYFFLAAVDLALGTDYLTRKVRDPGRTSPVHPDGSTGFPIGGFAATGENDDTMRNAIAKYYGRVGEGGECVEGYEYCNGTEILAAIGMQGVNDFTKTIHYPEMMRFFADNAKQLMHQFTPDLRDAHKAGDVQTSRGLMWHALDDNIAHTAAISGSAELQQFWYDLAAANGREIWTTPFLYARPFYLNNPYRRTAPWKAWAGLSHAAPGTGHIYARSGWGPSDCSVHLFFPAASRGSADHFPSYANFFRLRCGRTWLRDTMIAYSADWRLANTAVIMNTGASREVADLVGTAFIDGKLAYGAGVSGGYTAQIQPGSYNPPPPFYHENFGHRLVLFGPAGTVPTIVAMDRLSAEDPRVQKTPGGAPVIARYAPAIQTRFRNALGVYDWLTHTPVAPNVDPDGKSFSWVVNGIEMRNAQVWPVEAPVITVVDDLAKHREVAALSPPLSKLRAQWKAAQNEPASDEQKARVAELSATVAAAQSSFDSVAGQRVSGTVAEAERKIIVHQVPPYQPFLFGANCLTGGAGPSDRCVGIEFGDLKGVRVIRSAMPDVIFLASQRPSPKLPSTMTRNAVGGAISAFDRAGKATLLEQARIVTSLPRIKVEVTDGREVLVYIADVEAGVKTVNVNGKDVPLSRLGSLATVTVGR